MKYNFLFYVHTSFFIFYSFLHYPFSVSLSLLHLHLFFLPPQTHKPFFLPQRPIANLHEPSRHRTIVVKPLSTTDLTHFGLYSLFRRFSFVFRAALVFWLCVSSLLVCSDLCFGLGGLVFRAGFLFRAWVSVCGFNVWVNGFGFGGFRHLVVAVGLFVVCCGFVLWWL